VPNYDRILTVCWSIERIAGEAAISALENLLASPYLSRHECKDTTSGDDNYMSAFLELVIARTLARCGGITGALVLADYLDDVRKVLSDHAYTELKEITGVDFGMCSGSWKFYLKENRKLIPRPYTNDSVMVRG